LPVGPVSPDRALARNFRVIAILLVAVAESGCWEGTSRDTLATVLSLEGSASISVDGGRTFSDLRATQNPGSHAIVRSGPRSRLALALLPNCLSILDQNTALEINRLAITKDGNETGEDMRARVAETKLIQGRIFVSHVWGEAQARLVVSTGNGDLSTPSNANFWIEIADGKTRVTCVSGWVEFRPPGAPASTRVPPGSVGQWPSTGAAITAADADPRGQEDLEKGVELDRKLRELANQKRNVLPR
jgi:hypothetical protein